jgi:3'-5' exoribonuclease
VFLVKEKITAMAKNGKPYLTVRLMDKSGEVDAKVWDHIEEVGGRFEKNDFISVHAKASVYLGKLQLIISDLQRVPEEEVTLANFLPETERNLQEMESELATLVASLSNQWLKQLLQAFFDDPALISVYRVALPPKGCIMSILADFWNIPWRCASWLMPLCLSIRT